MIIGETLHGSSDSGTKAYYSPWFPRGGCGAEFVLDLLEQSSASAQIEFSVETKNSEQDNVNPGSVITIATSAPLSGIGQYGLLAGTRVDGQLIPGSAGGLLELVRFKFDLTQPGDWVHFRMLTPSWISDGA